MPPFSDELSLRHLPDISNTSFSFQIPNSSTSDLLLNNDDENSFFQNTDDTLATPGPFKGSHTPLALSELTPKQSTRTSQLPRGESPPPSEPKPRRNPRRLGEGVQARTAIPRAPQAPKQPPSKIITQIDELRGPEASPRAVKLMNLRAEVDSLRDNVEKSAIPSSPPPNHKHEHEHEYDEHDHEHVTEEDQSIGSRKKQKQKEVEKVNVRPKQVVYSGGISKVRNKPGASSARSISTTASSAPQSQASRAPVPAQFEENPDFSICSTMNGGVAERLVMYSQKLIGPFGLFNTDIDREPSQQPGTINPESRQSYPAIETNERERGLEHAHEPEHEYNDRNEDPFTLSQISPRKEGHAPPVSPATTPASPMRPSRKRPGEDLLVSSLSASSSSLPPREKSSPHRLSKKGKTKPTGDAPGPSSNSKTTFPSISRGTLSRSHASSASGSGSTRTRPSRDKFKAETKTKAKTTTRTRGLGVGGKRAVYPGPVTRPPRAGHTRLASNANGGLGTTLRASQGDDSTAPRLASSFGGSAHVGGELPSAGSVSARVVEGHDANKGSDTDVGPGVDAITNIVDGNRDADVKPNASTGRNTRVVLPSVNPTQPVGFKFQLDARIEARKAEHAQVGDRKKDKGKDRDKDKDTEEPRAGAGTGTALQTRPPPQPAVLQAHQYQHYHPAPDFKTLHAQLDASHAARKETLRVRPTVPVPVELSTARRAREREAFDARVKEKEREMERMREERRRVREEEEEREIRELRRRAVPKAHEVPEWYRDAPKRAADADVDVGADLDEDGTEG